MKKPKKVDKERKMGGENMKKWILARSGSRGGKGERSGKRRGESNAYRKANRSFESAVRAAQGFAIKMLISAVLLLSVIASASAQFNLASPLEISGVLEVTDTISNIGEVNTTLIENTIYSQKGITIWKVTPSLDPEKYFLTGLEFYAMLNEKNNALSILIDGEEGQALRGMIPSLHGAENIALNATGDPLHHCYPYNITKTLIYSVLQEVFEDLKSKSVISADSSLDKKPVYSSTFTDKVFIFGYYIAASEYDCSWNSFHNWPWGDGDDLCKYHPGCYACEYTDGSVEVTFNFNLSNPELYYVWGRIRNDNGEETKYTYNGEVWLHQVNYGSKQDVKYGNTSFPSQIVVYGRKTWSTIHPATWMAIVADFVNVTGSIHGVGPTTVDRSEEPDVLILISLNKTALIWPPIEKPYVFIKTDKTEYFTGDIMMVNITIGNPTNTTQNVVFNWWITIPSKNFYTAPLSVVPMSIPPGYDVTFSYPITVGYWGAESFSAVFCVALTNQTTNKIMSFDATFWNYNPTTRKKKMSIESIVEEIRKAIR